MNKRKQEVKDKEKGSGKHRRKSIVTVRGAAKFLRESGIGQMESKHYQTAKDKHIKRTKIYRNKRNSRKKTMKRKDRKGGVEVRGSGQVRSGQQSPPLLASAIPYSGQVICQAWYVAKAGSRVKSGKFRSESQKGHSKNAVL